MFLMNAPPVVALQSRWEAFGPPRSFHFPNCLSESKEEAARASVSARVQMIISTLQRDGATLGVSHERVTQRGQREERCRDTRLAPNPALCKEQPEFPACGLDADPDSLGKNQPGRLGPTLELGLDSDSDDSVDRDIEEAIQEYLRAKGGASDPVSQGVPCAPEPAHSSTLPILCPPQLPPGSGSVPGSTVGVSKGQGSASPASVSSEDSFEQSIRAEIEQFLNEKRQHETPKCDGSVDKKSDPNESSARLKGSREVPARVAPPQAVMGTCKEFIFRKPPRLAKMNAQPRSLRPKVTAEPETQMSARLATPRTEATQNRSGARRSTATRRSRRSRSSTPVHQASDSSSDDGIEEAIQLYQLEKTRKEASGDPPLRAQPKEESPGSTQPSALPEAHRKPPSKKKPAAPKADSTPGGLRLEPLSKLPKDAKAAVLPGHTATRNETAHKASCRADTSTELMCAEAILDISKTIVPAPVNGGDRPPSASPPSCPPAVPPRSDADSSAVDSDDSIEQEIRMFLALKAQVGSPQPAQGPLAPPGPNGQTGIPKTPLSKTPDLPQSCKRKRRSGGSSTVSKKTREVRESTQDGDHSQGKGQPSNDGQDRLSQGKANEVPGGEAETKGQPAPSRTVGLSDAHVSQGNESQGKAGEGKSTGEKGSSEDKSSSLDSDEDLDMAIKDLLRSKRKVKKRCRDPRAAWKKKVRFGATETRFGEKLGSLPGAWKDHGPQVLRGCLPRCRRDSPGRGLPSASSSVAERVKPGGTGDEGAAPAPLHRKRSPEGRLLSKDTAASSRPPPASSPLSEDSSVDSDDSIELEIRRFLAEKAKESVRSSEPQGGGPATLGPGSPARPEILCKKEPALGPQPGVCTRSQRARGTPHLAEGRRCSERAGTQAASLLSQTGRSTPRAEHSACPPATPGRCEAALPRNASGNSSARASPSSRKGGSIHKDPGPRGTETAAAESDFAQLPGSAKVGAESGSVGGTFHLNYGSQNLLTPSPGPQADLTLPWSDFTHQSRLPSPWTLNSGQGTAWTGVFGGEKEKGAMSQAGAPPSLSSGPRKGLPLPGFSPLLSTQLFHFGKSVSWGGQQAGLFSPSLGLSLQGPAFSTFRGTQPGHSPVFGSPHLLMKDGGHWQSWKAQGSLKQHHRRRSGPEDNILDLRYQHRDAQAQEALGSDASEFSDTSVEDGGSNKVKGKVLKL
ncbi:protein phosphatase 1 regulatory subunit 26 [Nannospalax galili]|uniref:protein phosphatase 1 regulatory subunit 26 n=1 Tax=Nannospalax galili TaxID=1026970 RepID=UPI0004ED64F6|nr:protein phosphatase 1 regulatory subunit 26 [Nannospalax galili]XP_008842156.1 protein phosphatase 1 regulatory subunit 26 [Nannospalax galili]XP_008842157.1 protein phosphatase 1 regulatory subunit 26 [Nannospalax galili]XP_008842158.1 protein phosphatase 1 regulatory subunit 26 [Nannospalax galili]XP_008842159.1 protein phosphatase 1 regulatory subunit 26 [Nannospalax galili]XP_008842160.1 protein phosphatase 1 regulatory subunit 26 [Nannospalax galili]